jgi:hypothetical protein
MLRQALIVFAVVLMLAGISGPFWNGPGFIVSIWGLILLLAVLFERWRYRSKNAGVGSEWQATDERFIDPETGQLTQVMYNTKTGDRSYRAIGGNGDAPSA